MKGIHVGLIGWGTVGSGVIKILQENEALIEERLGSRIVLKRIADIDLESERAVKVNRKVLTSRAEEVIGDPEIDVVLELIGGMEPARSYILEAFKRGKHVVTANKALLEFGQHHCYALEHRFLFEIQIRECHPNHVLHQSPLHMF